MRAIVLEKFGGLDSLVYTDLPEPEPLAGHVVIEIEAFGLNHAEMHMRRGEWAEAAKMIGIECVGLVHSCPGGEFPIGAKVAALMGGLGRTINGSYAEYTRVRASNVALIESDLPWAELAAIPETYATAWTCLFRNLEIVRGQTLVIRGAASSFGQAALNMAVDAGVRVIATTRGRERVALLQQLGAERVEAEEPELSKRIAEAKKPDAVFSSVWGGHFVTFAKQAKPLKYFESFNHNFLGAGEAGAIETAKAMGDDYPYGVWANSYDAFNWAEGPAAHKEYIARLRTYTKEEHPSSWPITGYVGMQILAAAIEKAGSTDSDKVSKAMQDITVDTPIGKQTIRSKDQQANRAQFWGKMTKDPKYPFAVMSPPTYVDPTPFMD